MRLFIVALLMMFSLNGIAQTKGGDAPVKKSKTGICHAPGTTYYSQTKSFTPYKSLDDCIKGGGRLPKK